MFIYLTGNDFFGLCFKTIAEVDFFLSSLPVGLDYDICSPDLHCPFLQSASDLEMWKVTPSHT
jgi:hypothetical protein